MKCIVCEREDFVLNSLIEFKPVKRFENRSDVVEFGSFGDSSCSGIKNQLKTVGLSSRKVEQKRITVVQFRVNEGSSNSTSCSKINGISNASQISNMIEAGFRNCRDVLRKCKITIKDDS